MFSVFKKEINAFLNSLMGYFIVILFLLFVALFLWILPSEDNNILDMGYASLTPLFYMAPWVFIFLISAVTMRLFSDEKRTGTIEFLYTKPLTEWDIVLGKYLAGFTLALISILPTLVYYYSVYQLGDPKGNIDTPAVVGSYLGLIFLTSGFTAIGIFSSSVTNNPIVSFLLACFLSFLIYLGFELLSEMALLKSVDHIIKNIGIHEHYNSMSRGVIDTRDVVYFLSLSVVFLWLTKLSLERRTW